MATRDGEKTGGRQRGTPNKPKSEPTAGLQVPTGPGWLLVATQKGPALISPYPARDDGPSDAELDAILTMQRRLASTPVAIWIDDITGVVRACAVAPAVLAAKASQLVTCRLRHYRLAA